MKKTKENFSKTTYTTQEKIISTTKMIQSSFTALPSSTNVKEGKYLWSGLENNVSIISIIIISILIIGIIKNRKNLFAQISSIWLLFSAILFILLNWSTHETPLFTIYFSWSIIPLFVMGLDFIIQKAKLNKKVIYGLILTFITIINIATMFDINNFLLTL